ncbi:hypothetical protein VNO80_25136 [Phaseolus coccineus]|uniref:Uncharacterized protein n=1 Tax=Phaseolus coccineus TaxID=3886 RepID=A0AAN9LU21_PHACN
MVHISYILLCSQITLFVLKQPNEGDADDGFKIRSWRSPSLPGFGKADDGINPPFSRYGNKMYDRQARDAYSLFCTIQVCGNNSNCSSLQPAIYIQVTSPFQGLEDLKGHSTLYLYHLKLYLKVFVLAPRICSTVLFVIFLLLP